MRVVVGVDSSTQSTKVEVRHLDTGAVLGRGSAPHPATTPPRSEQHPESWWSAFEAAHAEAMGSVGAVDVVGISVAGQQHGMVTLDRDGGVVRAAKLWNDTESALDAERLCSALPGGPSGWAAAVGSVPVAAFTISKLGWLARAEPQSLARTAAVLLPHDWMTFRLTGEYVTDRGDASGTGYWSPAEEQYRTDLLGLVADVDWPSMLPRVAAPNEIVGEWNGVPVACGTGDNMGAALGIGLQAGTAVVSVGTSGTAYTVASEPTADASGAVAGFASADGRYLPLVCTLNAGKVLAAVARLLAVDHDGLDHLAAQSTAGSRGLTLLPYFDGERTPNLPGASGWLTGLRTDVGRDDVARAAVEGVCCSLLDAVDELARHAPVRRVLLTGGGARSEAVRGVFAGLSPWPVQVVDADEAVAAGAAVQACAVAEGIDHAEVARRWGLGAANDVVPWTAGGEVRERYAAARERAEAEARR
ncbi:MAG: xylulokinase [Actinomycetota bacterium]